MSATRVYARLICFLSDTDYLVRLCRPVPKVTDWFRNLRMSLKKKAEKERLRKEKKAQEDELLAAAKAQDAEDEEDFQRQLEKKTKESDREKERRRDRATSASGSREERQLSPAPPSRPVPSSASRFAPFTPYSSHIFYKPRFRISFSHAVQ